MDEKIYYIIAMAICFLLGIALTMAINPFPTITETTQTQNNTIELNLKIIRGIAMDCYWATEYATDYKGTLEHFEGTDYSQEFKYDCIKGAHLHWETLQTNE